MNARSQAPLVEGWDVFNETNDDHMQAVAGEYLWKSIQDLLMSSTWKDLSQARDDVRRACIRKFKEDV
jgi:hypothetical protein